jgi:hypothetical protein
MISREKKTPIELRFRCGSHPDSLFTVNTAVLQPSWMSASHPERANALDKFLGKTSTSRKTFKAIVLGFDGGEYAVALMDIRNDVKKISSLVGDAMELAALRRERSRRVNTKFWSSIRQYADSLFQSIRWQCACASDHTVNLRLQTRAKKEARCRCYISLRNSLCVFGEPGPQ